MNGLLPAKMRHFCKEVFSIRKICAIMSDTDKIGKNLSKPEAECKESAFCFVCLL